LNVLFQRDLREAIAPVGLVLGILMALEISVGLTPWARDPEVARTLSELMSVLLTAALALAFQRQRGDLRKERLRHLLTLPITPAQVLVSKMAVCCLLSTVVLLAVNGLWFLSGVPDNAAYTIGYVLQATVNMCLVVLLFWGALAATPVLGTWFMFILIAGALFLARDVPEPYHPMTLALPPESGDQSLLFARAIALALIIVLFIAIERLLTLRPVE
jgi:hypothetical protein